MKKIVVLLLLAISSGGIYAQYNIADMMNLSPAKTQSMRQKETILRNDFQRAGFSYPVKQVFIRSFKYDHELEVWVRNSEREPFTLFKTYKVCVMAGDLGPKRLEGDFQVPEGFYYISEFKPNSEFYLSLKLNYPNESDRILSDKISPGGEIYIHGSCVSVGCIPLQNNQVEEVYLLTSGAKLSGQKYIPVHVYPFRFNNTKALDYYTKYAEGDYNSQRFTLSLRYIYDYFERTKQLPLIGINSRGEYELLSSL